MTLPDTSPHSWTTHCLRRQRELAHTPRRRWFCSWKLLTHLLLVCNRLLIKLVTMTTSSLSAKKRSQKEDLTKSGMFTWFCCYVTWGIFIQSSTAEGNFPGVDKAAETWTWRADIGGGGGWRGQEGLGQRPYQAGIPLYTEVPRAKRGDSNNSFSSNLTTCIRMQTWVIKTSIGHKRQIPTVLMFSWIEVGPKSYKVQVQWKILKFKFLSTPTPTKNFQARSPFFWTGSLRRLPT